MSAIRLAAETMRLEGSGTVATIRTGVDKAFLARKTGRFRKGSPKTSGLPASFLSLGIEQNYGGIKTGAYALLREQHGRCLLTGHVVSGAQQAWV
jgi:hypothetical protein